MAEAVYLLCAGTSIVCAAMLWNGYRRSRTALLMWSSICFAGLAINNALVVVDFIMVPHVDLSIVRATVAVVAMAVLIHALIAQPE